MAKSRRCHVCNHLLDPLLDEAYSLMKGVGSRTDHLKKVFWLCQKHGAAYERVVDDARRARLQPDKYGKIAAGNAANGEVK